MFRLCVCDDNSATLTAVENLLEAPPLKGHFRYDLYESSERLLDCLNEKDYNIFLLDIELGQMDGLTLAHKLREQDPYALILFMTNYPHYVYDVFDVRVFDFIQKKDLSDKLPKALTRAEKDLMLGNDHFIFHTQKQHLSLPLRDILYIEKEARKAVFHTRTKVYECNLTIKELWEQLDPELFISVYSWRIVNIMYITAIQGNEVTLINGETLHVGKEYSHALKAKHLAYRIQ